MQLWNSGYCSHWSCRLLIKWKAASFHRKWWYRNSWTWRYNSKPNQLWRTSKIRVYALIITLLGKNWWWTIKRFLQNWLSLDRSTKRKFQKLFRPIYSYWIKQLFWRFSKKIGLNWELKLTHKILDIIRITKFLVTTRRIQKWGFWSCDQCSKLEIG